MAVYVDELRNWGWSKGASCHLLADTPEELHAFAAKVGLLSGWFQRRASTPHYDLTAARRKRAVLAGAVELDRPQLVAKMREIRPVWPHDGKGNWL